MLTKPFYYINTHPFLGTKVKACSERNLQLILNSICLDRAILLLTTYAFNQARSPHNFGLGPIFEGRLGRFRHSVYCLNDALICDRF